jgi:hypothetical protein
MDTALQSAFVAEALALLILLAGAILLYRSFREKYLASWIAGWIVYSLSKLFMALSVPPLGAPLWMALGYAFLPIGAVFFATAIFIYVDHKRWLLLSWGLAGAAVPFGVLMAVRFPRSTLVGWVYWFCWSPVLWLAAWQLVKFARGRDNFGRWLLAAMLLFTGTILTF